MRDKLLVNIGFSVVIIVLALALYSVLYNANSSQPKTGSVDSNSGGYYSSSTDSGWNNTNNVSSFRLLKNGPGILGSWNTTAGTSTISTLTGVINFYDATTTTQGGNGNPYYATTSLVKMSTSVPGSYIFDLVFNKGLIAEFPNNNVASGTVTFK